jgi:hypothetical protein
MGSLIIYFLPTILALGAKITYDDLTKGKVMNMYVLAGLVLSILTHSILYASQIIELRYILVMLFFVCIAMIIGVALWFFGYFSACDAKVLTVFVSLVPLPVYVYSVTQIVILEILVNALIFIMIFLIFRTILRTNITEKKRIIKEATTPKKIGFSMLLIFSVSWLVKYVFLLLNIKQNYLLSIIMIIATFKIIKKIMTTTELLALMAVSSILRIFLNKEAIISWTFAKEFFIITLGFLIMMSILKEFEKYQNTEKKTKHIEEYLTIQGHKTRKVISKSVLIEKKIGISPFIFMGTLTTIICQGNVIMFLTSALGN